MFCLCLFSLLVQMCEAVSLQIFSSKCSFQLNLVWHVFMTDMIQFLEFTKKYETTQVSKYQFKNKQTFLFISFSLSLSLSETINLQNMIETIKSNNITKIVTKIPDLAINWLQTWWQEMKKKWNCFWVLK